MAGLEYVTGVRAGAVKKQRVAIVEWIDSCRRDDQSDDLPSPTLIRSVGWLAHRSKRYVVLVRDQHTDESSYEWRGALAIPRECIRKVRVL